MTICPIDLKKLSLLTKKFSGNTNRCIPYQERTSEICTHSYFYLFITEVLSQSGQGIQRIKGCNYTV